MTDEAVNPTALRVEAASHCQLRCPSCPTTSGATHPAIGGGFLRASDFARLLDQNPRVREVELSNYGEIFLNPELSDILRIGHERGIVLTAQNGVNLNSVRAGVLEDLVRYGLRSMTCSIDGVTPETYARYRVRGSLAAVLDNIRTINALKRRHGSPYPIMRWQFVVFGHNEHEIPVARRLAAELKMDFFPKLSWDEEFSPIHDREFVLRETGLDTASRDEYRRQFGEDYAQSLCRALWTHPQINWDGRMLGCARNFWGNFGANAFTEGLHQAVNSERMRYARSMLIGNAPARRDIPCTTCEIYLDMRAEGRWLQASSRRSLSPGQALSEAAKYLALGRLIDAETLYLKIVDSMPGRPEALLGMAQIRYGLGWNEWALTFAQAAADALPGDRRPHDILKRIEREMQTQRAPKVLETITP